MTTPDQLRTLVRFGLDQLRTRNAHHDFEHLCRHLARARICSNIIPSSGPVSAGGDQGRDFETFRTYLDANAKDRSIFAGFAAKERLAFACTLQATNLGQKLHSDIDTICASGLSVSCIHVFFVEDLPVAKRHTIQAWAQEKYHVDVELYDGNAIAELLVDSETFWIASRYLEIPADQFPVKAGDEWYTDLANRTRGHEKRCDTDGELFELKQLARHATEVEGLRPDLPEWLSRLETVPKSEPRLWRAAMYEVFVASLRGLGSLEGHEDHIREYLAGVPEMTSPGELRDVACLLSYCIGAVFQHVLRVELEEISKWWVELTSRADVLLDLAETPNLRCALLDVRWFIAVSVRPGLNRAPILDDGFPWLRRLSDEVVGARLFPLGELIDNLTQLQSFMPVDDTNQYMEVTRKLDAALAVREGDHAVASKLRDRAMAFRKAKRPLLALRSIHDANVKWFSHETLHASLISQLFLADTYDSLGLCKAAQYFALAQTYIALNSELPGIRAEASRGLFAAAEYAYHAGEWLRFLELAEMAVRVHARCAPSPGDIDRHPVLGRLGFCAVCVVVLLEKFDPAAGSRALARVKSWNLDWLLDSMFESARSSRRASPDGDTWSQLQRQLSGRPMSDGGRTRSLAWRQLGVHWRFRWSNHYQVSAYAEQLIAVLQIVLADLAEDDLCLLPATVSVRVKTGSLDIVREPSNHAARWTISVPVDQGPGDSNAITAVGAMLLEISLLPSTTFLSTLEERFKSGLSSKVFVARPYSELFGIFVSKRSIRGARDETPTLPAQRFRLREHSALAWRSELGPYYPRDEIEKWLTRRYTRLSRYIKKTLSALRVDPAFRVVLEALRASKWRDWHVLNAIYNVLLTEVGRVTNAKGPNEWEQIRERFDRLGDVSIDQPIDLSIFTEAALRRALDASMIATLKILGHEVHQRTPSFKAISKFLASRYRYWIDDVPHEDPFSSPSTDDSEQGSVA